MTEMIDKIVKTSSQRNLKGLKKEYERKLLESKKGSDEATYCCDVLDAIDQELEERKK